MFISDDASWERTLEALRPYLLLQARLHMHSWLKGLEEAEDLVQRTVQEIHESRAQFRGNTEAELRGWLHQALIRNIMDASRFHKKEKRDHRLLDSLDKKWTQAFSDSARWLCPDLALSETSPATYAQRHQQREKLVLALLKLPQAQRDAVEKHHLCGYSLQETAKFLGKTPSSAASLVFRGLTNMKKELGAGL